MNDFWGIKKTRQTSLCEFCGEYHKMSPEKKYKKEAKLLQRGLKVELEKEEPTYTQTTLDDFGLVFIPQTKTKQKTLW